jgi:hypothetical protein
MRGCGALAGRISVARVYRRRHQRADGMAWILEVAGEVVTTGDGFIIDSLPAPVCRRAHVQRCRKVRECACCGSCAAERETFVGWRLHLVCRPDGSPGRVPMLPAGVHDLTPGGTAVRAVRANNHSPLLSPLPCRRNCAADAASILAETGRGAAPLRPYARAPGDHASARLVDGRHRIARASSSRRDDERSTVTWSRWVLSDCTEAPMPGLSGRCMQHSLHASVRT